MFWSRAHLVWLGAWLFTSAAYAWLVIAFVVIHGLNVSGPGHLAVLLMAFYTVPVVIFYLVGLGAGWAFRRVRRRA